MPTLNSFNTRTEIRVGGQAVQIYSLPALEKAGFSGVSRLPYSMKILLENLLRREDNAFVKADDIRALAQWNATANAEKEISFMPARVLLQDFTGVPCVVDLAAMRDALAAMGADPAKANPLMPADLVIDHSVQVDEYGNKNAFDINAALEFSRNRERYTLLRPVVGFKLHGKLPEGCTATDLVLTVTQMLRKKGVVGKFVEFYGAGLSALSVADRATIANMAPEYGATIGFFPVDAGTLD